MEIDINGDYDFIDATSFEEVGTSPLVNLRDQAGNEYLCTIDALRDPKHPGEEACVKLEGLTTKGDMA